MTLPRTVADVLADHVVFEVECIDRMYCNVYVPQLQYAGGLLGYIQRQLGLPIASTAPLAQITDAFSRRDAPLRRATSRCRGWTSPRASARTTSCTSTWPRSRRRSEGVLFIGRAQEKTRLFRTEKRRDAARRLLSVDRAGHRGGQPVLLLLRRRRLRAVLPQVLLLLPLQRQAVPQRPRVGQAAGRQGRDRVHRAGQRVRRRSPTRPRCRRSATGSDRSRSTRCCASGWRCCRTRSPRRTGTPATATTSPILQAEFSLTQMLDRPVSGRVFFEQVIRDNLDVGRPDQVSLIFDRRLSHRAARRPRAGSAPG